MRDRGHFDLALEYLDAAEKSRAVSEEFRGRLDYERAATRLQQAQRMGDAAERERAVSRARKSLESYLASTDDAALAAEGSGKLAAALAEQGRVGIVKAERLTRADDKAEKNRLLQSARKSYDDARKLYQRAEADYSKAVDALKVVKPGSPEARRRLNLKMRLAGVRVMGARSLYDKAKSYGKSSKTFKQLNEEAATELVEHADRYYDQPIGMYASLYEGWCYQAVGNHKLAVGCFEELTSQDGSVDAFREVITLGHVYLALSRIAQKQYESAYEGATDWLGELSANELPVASAALKYQAGDAARLLAESEQGGDKRRRLVRAQQLLRQAGRVPGEFQSDARLKLADVNEALGAEDQPLATFADAYQAGKDAVSMMNASKLSAKVAETNNPDAAADLKSRVSEAQQTAREAFLAALALVDDETQVARVNEVRYLLSWLYWENEEYLRAAAIGEFLATAYSDDPSAKGAAKLALASFERLYNQAIEAGESEFERQRLKGIAQFAAKRWAGESTGNSALSVLMSLALRSGDIDDARNVVQQAPADRRASLELKLASALWERAVREAATAGDDARAQAGAQTAKDNARSLLQESYSKVKDSPKTTAALATAGLYLTQALVDEGDAAAALKVLEDKRHGPLTLVRTKDLSADRPGYAAEAYKVALRAYVSASPPRTDDALKTMDLLEKAVGSGPTLTRVYFGLGLQLQQQIKQLTASGKGSEASRLSGAFAVFLDKLAETAGDSDWVTQQWIGQTFLNLGEGLSGGPDSAKREEYFAKASGAFDSMIKRAASEPAFAPSPNSVLAARMQLGQAQRAQGNYDGAIETFSSLLTERNVLLRRAEDRRRRPYQRVGPAASPIDWS